VREEVSIPHRYAENGIVAGEKVRREGGFQFLIGTLKTLTKYILPPIDVRVSIPHRYAENYLFLKAPVKRCFVSIPHRYAENIMRNWGRISEGWLFQFLIGTLKTAVTKDADKLANLVSIPHRYAENLEAVPEEGNICIEFQFLIGTLKTSKRPCGYAGFCGFQFLIGTLKTVRSFLEPAWETGVSIPHRYAENPI